MLEQFIHSALGLTIIQHITFHFDTPLLKYQFVLTKKMNLKYANDIWLLRDIEMF